MKRAEIDFSWFIDNFRVGFIFLGQWWPLEELFMVQGIKTAHALLSCYVLGMLGIQSSAF